MTRISATMSDCGTRGTSTRKMPGYRKERKQTHFPYVHSSASPDARTGTFSRANTAAHHPHISSVGTPHLLQGERESSFSKCFTSIQAHDVFVECNFPTCVVFAFCSPFKTLSVYHTHWKKSGTTARARGLAGVSLAKWLTQLKTQVMISTSRTSSATSIRSTRR